MTASTYKIDSGQIKDYAQRCPFCTKGIVRRFDNLHCLVLHVSHKHSDLSKGEKRAFKMKITKIKRLLPQ